MTTDENKQIAMRAFHAFMGGDLDSLAGLLAPDAVLHQCGFPEPIPAADIISGKFPYQWLLDDRHDQLERIIGEGDIVALHWRTTGTYREAGSPEIDDMQVNFTSMSFIRHAEGQIAEIWNIQDIATLQSEMHDHGSLQDEE